MIVLTLASYYALAIALVGGAVLLALHLNKRDRATADLRHEGNLRKWRESTPPLPPRAPVVLDDATGAEDGVPDLSAPALRPIAPLLLRAAKEYLDKPHDRERLLRSLSEALGEPAPAT